MPKYRSARAEPLEHGAIHAGVVPDGRVLGPDAEQIAMQRVRVRVRPAFI